MTKLKEKTEDGKLSLREKLMRVQAQVSGVKKDSKGYNYDYESLDSVILLLHPCLEEAGLGVFHTVEGLVGEMYCVTTVFDETDKIEVKCPIIGGNQLIKGNPMQAIGSAITYCRRYNLKNLFNLFSTDDDARILHTRVASPSQVHTIEKLLAKAPEDFDKDAFFEWLKEENLEDVTFEKAKVAIEALKKKVG